MQLVKIKSQAVAADRSAGHKQLVRIKSHAVVCFLFSTASSQPKGQAPCQLMTSKEPRAVESVTLCVGTHVCAEDGAHSDAAFMGGSVQWPVSRRREGIITGTLGVCCMEGRWSIGWGTVAWGNCWQSDRESLQTVRALRSIIVWLFAVSRTTKTKTRWA
jgi:hypothetical protein